MSWKGTKENVSSLPQSGNQVGDLWHVNEDGNEYAWDGSKWEALGGISGEDGFSPTVSTSQITGGTRVTITDAEGSHNFDVMNGQPGVKGDTGTWVATVSNGVLEVFNVVYQSAEEASF